EGGAGRSRGLPAACSERELLGRQAGHRSDDRPTPEPEPEVVQGLPEVPAFVRGQVRAATAAAPASGRIGSLPLLGGLDKSEHVGPRGKGFGHAARSVSALAGGTVSAPSCGAVPTNHAESIFRQSISNSLQRGCPEPEYTHYPCKGG